MERSRRRTRQAALRQMGAQPGIKDPALVVHPVHIASPIGTRMGVLARRPHRRDQPVQPHPAGRSRKARIIVRAWPLPRWTVGTRSPARPACSPGRRDAPPPARPSSPSPPPAARPGGTGDGHAAGDGDRVVRLGIDEAELAVRELFQEIVVEVVMSGRVIQKADRAPRSHVRGRSLPAANQDCSSLAE